MGGMTYKFLLISRLWISLAGLAVAQDVLALTTADYARAERFMGYNTQALLEQAIVSLQWLDNSHFWYQEHDRDGDHFFYVDAVSGQRHKLIAAERLAAALSRLFAQPLDPKALPITAMAWTAEGQWRLRVRDKVCVCAADASSCHRLTQAQEQAATDEVLAPDGKYAAFVRHWNLWLRDTATGKETPLTRDGVENNGYATDNAGWEHSDRAILVWSPDSTQIATFQQDQRQTGNMYLLNTRHGRPQLQSWKYPLPGDRHVTMIKRVVIDVASRRVVRLDLPPDQHRSTLCDDIRCGRDTGWADVQWAPDSQSLAFVSTSRDHRHVWFRLADPHSGKVRTVFSERVATYYESGIEGVSWRYLPASQEAIWYSARTGWGQLYLYGLRNGRVKHAITDGMGNVSQLLYVDRVQRAVWFTAVGRVPGLDPYYRQLWRVSLDGGTAQLLTPEKADHTISMAPGGQYFVDSYSTPVTPPHVVLRRASDGKVLATLARTSITRLRAAGWVPPQPITVLARDGKTMLYGELFKPSSFDPSKKYPIVDFVYPGPQLGSVRGRSFLSARGDNQALAELGFIVVAIDGMGTPWRTKSFHDIGYGDLGDNTLPDQVAALKQLGARYPWIDLTRVGIWGHSGGGSATVAAMFRYPDFFKVGWAESGNYDNRGYEDDWGEKYQGLLESRADGSSNYDNQAEEALAKHLQGHLMLVHGSLDDNVPLNQTLLLTKALIKANKDFDMLIIPNARHDYGQTAPYIRRRRWDYFVRYLAGKTPPANYRMQH